MDVIYLLMHNTAIGLEKRWAGKDGVCKNARKERVGWSVSQTCEGISIKVGLGLFSQAMGIMRPSSVLCDLYAVIGVLYRLGFGVRLDRSSIIFLPMPALL